MCPKAIILNRKKKDHKKIQMILDIENSLLKSDILALFEEPAEL